METVCVNLVKLPSALNTAWFCDILHLDFETPLVIQKPIDLPVGRHFTSPGNSVGDMLLSVICSGFRGPTERRSFKARMIFMHRNLQFQPARLKADHNAPCLPPPKFCITIVFEFSLDDCKQVALCRYVKIVNS